MSRYSVQLGLVWTRVRPSPNVIPGITPVRELGAHVIHMLRLEKLRRYSAGKNSHEIMQPTAFSRREAVIQAPSHLRLSHIRTGQSVRAHRDVGYPNRTLFLSRSYKSLVDIGWTNCWLLGHSEQHVLFSPFHSSSSPTNESSLLSMVQDQPLICFIKSHLRPSLLHQFTRSGHLYGEIRFMQLFPSLSHLTRLIG